MNREAPDADAPYSQLSQEWTNESFIQRVQVAMLQDVLATKILSTPPAAADTSIEAQRDRLGRQIRDDPHTYAIRAAWVIAVQLIGKSTLLDPLVTTDGDIFAAEGAIFDKLLPSL